LRILVAEDEKNILRMYRVFLEGEGFEVITSQDGVECLKQYQLASQRNTPFDIVILDYRMPRMDGRTAALEILAINPCQTIIMITAFSRGLSDFSGLEKVQVLQKPFELENLGDLLRSVLQPETRLKKEVTE
jgi:two-component system cell cycle response regulator CpdR